MSEPITIVYPHYMATEWMIRSIKSHRQLADNSIRVWVIDMSHREAGFMQTQQKTMELVDHFIWLQIHRKRYYCGEALEIVLPLIGTVVPEGITVLADTDTLMLRKGWDTELRVQLETNDLVALNQRSIYEPYIDTPEWNWMAFRHGMVWSFHDDEGLNDIDWGQYVKRRFRYKTKLYGFQSVPVKRCCYAAVCGDEKGPWAFHAFFSTSKLAGDRRETNMAMTDEEMNAVCKTLCPTVFPN